MLPVKKKNKPPKLYWSLILEPEWVQAGIWKITNDQAALVSVSPPSAWELDEELIETTDSVLTSAVQELPEEYEVEPEDTVFGILTSWVKDGDIKDDHLRIIKKICNKLDLNPAGFVVLPEAIAHYYKSKEETPLNAVVLGVLKESLEISVFKSGDLSGTTQVARSVSYIDDVNEGLSRLDISEIPSRIILYNAKETDLEEVSQKLLKANWDDLEEVNFLHTPKIQILTSQEKLQAVSLAGASEIGDVASIASVEKKEKKKLSQDSELENVKEPEDDLTVKELGFVVGRDIADMNKAEKKTEKQESAFESSKNERESKQVQESETTKKKSSQKLPPMPFKKLSSALKKVKLPSLGFIPRPGLSDSPFGKTFLIGILLLLGVFVSGFLAWWFLPKATVTVYLSTKPLDERITIVTGQEADNDEDIRRVSADTITKQASGSDTRSTTGTKLVGDRAGGEVTIYRVGPEISLSSGTTLTGPGGLEFTLDGDVTLASGSALNAGTTNASVTAADIGAQYNLASNSTFSVANYSTSDVEARNDDSFTGGSSREINAVSENDQQELEDDLTEELINKVKEDIISGLRQNQILVEESIDIEVLEQQFSNKVGDEASSLNLDMEVEASALILNKVEILEIAMAELRDRVPEGFVLRESQIETEFDIQDSQGDVYEIIVKVKANLLPEIKPEDIAQTIEGRYPEIAERYLQSEVPGFVRADIILQPTLPGRLKTLPHVSENIEVEISSDR